jgi:hypothetical protein
MSRPGILSMSEPADVSALMAAQDAAGFGFRNALYRGALAGDYRIAELLPRGRIPAPFLWRDAPSIVVVISDDGGLSDGPQDFPQARRLLAWADRLMVHATGGEEAHYSLLAAAARKFPRVLLVETHTAAEAAWMDLVVAEQGRRHEAGIPLLQTLLIQVAPGKPAHPVAPEGCA